MGDADRPQTPYPKMLRRYTLMANVRSNLNVRLNHLTPLTATWGIV
jgi:hypothetical protein